MIRLLKNLYKLIPNVGNKNVILATYLYLLISLITPTHKLLFVVSFVFFVTLLLITTSIEQAIIYSFFPFLLFNVGRDFTINVVPASAVLSPLYWDGRNIVFEFSPFFILAITSIFILAVLFFKRGLKAKTPLFFYLFLGSYALHFVSTLKSPYLRELSLAFLVSEFAFLVWLFIAFFLVSRLSVKMKRELLVSLLFIFVGLVFLESSVTIAQVIKRSVLGLSIEKVDSIPSFGYGIDENPLLFRPVGLNYHANSLANWHVLLMPAVLLLWIKVKNFIPSRISKLTMVLYLSLSLTTILLTLSRSAFLSVGIFVLLFFVFERQVLEKAIKFSLRYFRNYKILILVSLIYFSFVLPDRIFRSLYSFSETGGFATRKEQIVEALDLIRIYPLWGVGIRMFIPASYDLWPKGVVSYFPEDIHNGFILYVAERGLVATFIYLIGLYYMTKCIVKYEHSKVVRLIMFYSVIASFAMMAFQPFINTMSVGVLVTALILGSKVYEKAKS